MPSFHLAMTFLGQPCGSGLTHGVNPEMYDRLQAADNALQAIFDALPAEQRIDAFTGESGASFSQWAGVYEPHVCWRPWAAQHSAGAAIDINSAANPYIVTRNGDVPGGEQGGENLVEMRKRTLAAYDRAMQFTARGSAADVSPRRSGESTEAVWGRFNAASDALAEYLSIVVDPALPAIRRVAFENADEISDEELLAAISEEERVPLEPTLARLEEHLDSNDARATYLRILRDYEHARIPLVVNEAPNPTPAVTRNPARGFLHLRREIASALCAQGLRWGACDLEIFADGSSYNGAMMHFDLADRGGYPEVNSLLRFG